MSESRPRLLEARRLRVAPLRDDKVVTSWNALAVSAFAKAAQVLGDKRYLQVAEAEIRHLLALSSDGRRLTHNRLAGNASETVFLNDYAFLIQALLDLYETDFRVSRLDGARRLMETLIEGFQDEPGLPFRFTPVDHSSDIPARTILDEEGIPSGNAAALTALHGLVLSVPKGPSRNKPARSHGDSRPIWISRLPRPPVCWLPWISLPMKPMRS